MPRPLARGDPHDGLAAAVGIEVPRVRRLVHLPDGRGHGHDRDGRRARLPRRGALGARPSAGAEDAPGIRPILEGGERVAWGAKTIPEGGFVALPRQLWAPGMLIAGDGAGLVNVPALKGIHYAVESGRLAAEAAWRAIAPEGRGGWLPSYDESLRKSFVWRDLRKVRNMRQAFGSGFWRGSALAGLATVTRRQVPAWRPADRARRRAGDLRRPTGPSRTRPRTARSRSTSSRRCSCPGTAPATTSRITSASRRGFPRSWPSCGPGCARPRSTSRALRARRPGRAPGQPLELRPVRRDHREGRPPHPARRRLGPRVHDHLRPRRARATAWSALAAPARRIG